MPTKEEVLKALGTCQEPELHKDIVTLGMVQNLVVEGGKVSFDYVLTTPACPLKGLMQCHNLGRVLPSRRHIFIERKVGNAAAAFVGQSGPRLVHENAPHDLRGHAKKVRAVAPHHATLIDQSQVRFMHQRCSLQRCVHRFETHGATRLMVQLVVHRVQQPLPGRPIARTPGEQQVGHIGRRGRRFAGRH